MMTPGSHDNERPTNAGSALAPPSERAGDGLGVTARELVVAPHFGDKKALRAALHRDFEDVPVGDMPIVQARVGDPWGLAVTDDVSAPPPKKVTPWRPVHWLLVAAGILAVAQFPLLWAFSEAKQGAGPAVFTCLDLKTDRINDMTPRERITLERRCDPNVKSVETFITADPVEKVPDDAQIVELDMPAAVDPKPVETKFLAEVTTRTEKETRSEVAAHSQKGAGAAKVKQAAREAPEKATSPEKSTAPPDVKIAKPDETPADAEGDPVKTKGTKEPQVADIIQNQKGDVGNNTTERKVMERGDGGGGAHILMRPGSQMDALANIQALAGDYTSNDHLPDVDRGKSTVLNANAYKYADFFQAVKRAVERQWKPSDTYLRRDPSGQVYGVKDRYTVLRVELDRSGKILSIITTRPSGLDFMDEEAKRAFREAQPFANPPLGLADADGHIRFEFGFFFEITGGKYRFNWRRL